MLKRFSVLPVRKETEHGATQRERQDREHRDRVEERVELRSEHHVRDHDSDHDREPEAARRLLELRGLTVRGDPEPGRQGLAKLVDLVHRLLLGVPGADVALQADRALAI